VSSLAFLTKAIHSGGSAMLVFQAGTTPRNQWLWNCLRSLSRASISVRSKETAAVSFELYCIFDQAVRRAGGCRCAVLEMQDEVMSGSGLLRARPKFETVRFRSRA
jgi:hypothetical protein